MAHHSRSDRQRPGTGRQSTRASHRSSPWTQGGRSCARIADLACGHGLVGLLLAYRFPQRDVIWCVYSSNVYIFICIYTYLYNYGW